MEIRRENVQTDSLHSIGDDGDENNSIIQENSYAGLEDEDKWRIDDAYATEDEIDDALWAAVTANGRIPTHDELCDRCRVLNDRDDRVRR